MVSAILTYAMNMGFEYNDQKSLHGQ
jgi:hypothetical protein